MKQPTHNSLKNQNTMKIQATNSSELNTSEEKPHQMTKSSNTSPPIISSYNEQIRPLLDAIDKLRLLNIMQEGIQLPTIVVVGDQSSGKSSVLESLAGINLPRGQGICTRVPLIMRLQHHPTSTPILTLEYLDKIIDTDETHVADAIKTATELVAGLGKGISHTPLTLVVKKDGVPDLTMVDLPGITRVPVSGQPNDIYEQIKKIIMEYITPQESIILNVLSATVDFTTCESIRMSQMVDKAGERTLAVVTKADMLPQGLLEKVTGDDVRIGLGYVCVRNRIGDESYEEARSEEVVLFESHPMLSKIDKSMVGVPVLAEKLTRIQALSIAKCLPGIVKQINEKLNVNMEELINLPNNLSSPAEAMVEFVKILCSVKESLKKLLIRGEYDEFPDEKEMHCTARMNEMLNEFLEKLMTIYDSYLTADFLMEEISVLEEAKGITLPNFVSRSAFLNIMQKKIKSISSTPDEFVAKIWSYIEEIVVRVLTKHSENYLKLMCLARRAAQNLTSKLKDESLNRVRELIEMETLTDYTCVPEYLTVWNNLMANQSDFMQAINSYGTSSVSLGGIGVVPIAHLKNHKETLLQPAFDMKMRVVAYWKIVIRRVVDSVALHLILNVNKLVDKELEKEVIIELMASPAHGGGIEKMLEESPKVAGKRERLMKSIELLKESKKVVSHIMDKIAVATIYQSRDFMILSS